MPELTIQSHRGPYTVRFGGRFQGLQPPGKPGQHLLIDANVARLYERDLKPWLSSLPAHVVEASEQSKALEALPPLVAAMLNRGIKRADTIVAIGGGVAQDIAAFIASTLMRGVAWTFHPTTLLAQADSCIGSKSSINVGGYKNMLGTYWPPREIHIAVEVLGTLSAADFRSGLGEIIKVHIIDGWAATRALEADYRDVTRDARTLEHYIRHSLLIKKQLIEADEFDTGPRLVLNYGHTFGHAIESASGYAVPHGIAVTLGMSMANFFSWRLGLISADVFDELQGLLRPNYAGFERLFAADDAFLGALARDKKNAGDRQALVLMRGPGAVFRTEMARGELASLSAEFQNWLAGTEVPS